MPRGPKPKPTAIKIIEGRRSHRPLPVNEPQAPPGMPEIPDYLDDLALEEWEEMAAGLVAMGVLARTDKAVFSTYCVNFSIVRRARLGLQALFEKSSRPESALIYPDSKGILRPNPLLRVAADAEDRLLKAAAELGMTPSARARLATSAGDEAPIKKMLKVFPTRAQK